MDIFEFDERFYKPDLVYFDPPYVPRSDDNCYINRHHFLEGLSKYWADEEIVLFRYPDPAVIGSDCSGGS